MYIEIDDSVTGLSLDEHVDYNDAINNLAASAAEGNHFVVGSAETLRQLASLNNLTVKAKAYLRFAANWRHQYAASLATASRRVRVVADPYPVVLSPQDVSWVVPLSVFKSMSLATRAILLAENLTDCDLYIRAARHYQIVSKLDGFSVVADPEGGGGSTMSSRYRRLCCDKDKISICIADSDRYGPHPAPIKHEAQTCESLANGANWLTFCVITNSRELENALPEPFYDHALSYQIQERWQDAKSLLKDADPDAARFCDIKNGVSAKWILQQPLGSSWRNFWQLFVAQHNNVSQKAKDCVQQRQCIDQKLDGECCDSCTVVPAVAEDVAGTILKWLEERSDHEAAKLLRGPNAAEWLEIGSALFWTVCAPAKRMRV